MYPFRPTCTPGAPRYDLWLLMHAHGDNAWVRDADVIQHYAAEFVRRRDPALPHPERFERGTYPTHTAPFQLDDLERVLANHRRLAHRRWTGEIEAQPWSADETRRAFDAYWCARLHWQAALRWKTAAQTVR